MSLLPIVRALGGALYDHGARAVIPGPGHSAKDRSVSLWLTNGRLVVHSFGRSSWREVRDALRARGLVDAQGRPSFAAVTDWSPQAAPPSTVLRTEVAQRLWSEAQPLVRQLAMAHVRRRRLARPPPVSVALRHHPRLRSAVYADRGLAWPALLAAVTRADGELCAVEATYLDAEGRRAGDIPVSRKIIGALPPSCAVRLDPCGAEMLVGEGVFTTLSASQHFGLPGWALLSTSNLRTWRPPPCVRRVVIAADRGEEGERSAQHLLRHLIHDGLKSVIALPPPPSSDWNEAAAAATSARAGRGGQKAAEVSLASRATQDGLESERSGGVSP